MDKSASNRRNIVVEEKLNMSAADLMEFLSSQNSSITVELCNLPNHSILQIRRIEDGDKFHPVWKNNPIKVSELLRGQKIPAYLREEVLCIELINDTKPSDNLVRI